MTPKRRRQVRREERREDGRPQVHRLPRHLAAHHRSRSSELKEDVFEDGFGFDGSSIRGWQPINASDMLLIPDPATARDGSVHRSTRRCRSICNIVDPITQRAVLARPAQHRAEGRGVPQVDRHRRHVVLRPRGRVLHLRRHPLRLAGRTTRFYCVDSVEGALEHGPRGAARTSATSRATREATSRSPPTDTLQDIRTEMVLRDGSGRHPRRDAAPRGRHRRAVRDRHALQRRWSTMADKLMWFKYIVKNVARKHGKTATFMPKPLFGDNGSGMHCHQSHLEGRASRCSPATATPGCREMALYYIGGILKHAPALVRVHQPDARTATGGWCRASRRR